MFAALGKRTVLLTGAVFQTGYSRFRGVTAMLHVVQNAAKSLLSRDISAAIGNVPIVRLNRLNELCETHDFYLKLESCNPGGSIKEKNAVYLIQHAERTGLL